MRKVMFRIRPYTYSELLQYIEEYRIINIVYPKVWAKDDSNELTQETKHLLDEKLWEVVGVNGSEVIMVSPEGKCHTYNFKQFYESFLWSEFKVCGITDGVQYERT